MARTHTSPLFRYLQAAGLCGIALAGCYALDEALRWAGVPLLSAASVIAAWRSGWPASLAATLAAALGLAHLPMAAPGWLAGFDAPRIAAMAYLVIVLPAIALVAAARRTRRVHARERQRAEREIAVHAGQSGAWRERHARLAAAVDGAGLCAWMWDVRSGLVTLLAQSGAAAGAFTLRGHMQAAECLERIHEDDRLAVSRVLRRAAGRCERFSLECRLRSADGGAIWLLAQGRAVAAGRTREVYGVFQAIDERKRAEAAQADSDRSKDQFLAIVGHELRNPLNPMSAALQVLKERGEDEATRRWARLLIERQVRHLARLLDDLLDMSRLTHGRFALRREAVDICNLIGGTIDSVRADIDGKKQRVEFHVGRLDPLYVDGDAVRLTQVVSNLVTNAMKYSSSGSTITVQVEPAGDAIEITVSDTGIGIPSEDLERVFDLFAQSHAGSRFSGDGLGIGLYLVRGLVEMHGGRITAHSAGVGKGSSFRVTLPRARAPEAPLPAAGDRRDEARGRGPLRVVIADDNADSVDTLAMLLRLQGHEVHTGSHGGEAAELILAHRPDVAVIDIGMPVLNGYEVARRVRGELPHIVLIALSGWGNADDVERAKQAGFDHHMVKPADFERLERLITRAGGTQLRDADGVKGALAE